MKKFLILLLLIFTGCNLVGGPGKAADITGTEGLTIKVGTVQGTVYLGQSFTIPVNLENAGTTDIENAILSISGYNEEYIHLDAPPTIGNINLFGRTTFSPAGGKTTEIFRVGSISLPQNKDQITQVFQVKACYKYETIANPVVCINPKLGTGEPIPPGSCDYREGTLSPTQGAPIAVTKVTAITITSDTTNEPRMQFLIEVKDVSRKGKAVFEDVYAKNCLGNQPVLTEEVELIKIEAFLSGRKIECLPLSGEKEKEGTFYMVTEGPSVICNAPLDPQVDPYTAVLSIQLKYGYVNIAQPFTVTLKNPAIPSS